MSLVRSYKCRNVVTEDFKEILEGNTAHFAFEEACYRYQVVKQEITRLSIHELKCSHQEAITGIIFHDHFVTEMNTNTQIVSRSRDADVFVLLLHFARTLGGYIWMDIGSSSKNTRRCINITNLAMNLGPKVCSALPAFHIFTGSGYTPGFMRKEKLPPYDTLAKNQHLSDVFSIIGCSNVEDPETYSFIEKFVCSVYGQAKCQDVNVARLVIFKKIYAPNSIKQPLQKKK